MATGGKREGAGRKKGVPNKKTQEQVDAIKATGLTPLEYFASIYQDEEQTESTRLDAAKAAAPYIHPKLSSTEVNAKLGIYDHESALDEFEGEDDPPETKE